MAIKAFPVITVSNRVLVDSRLYSREEKVFMHFMVACRMYERDQLRSETKTSNFNM